MKLTVMMDRSSNSSEHSPPLSDNVGAETWLQFWENEISSVSGKNLGSNLELNTLVEDKEIAARAVAFVVNSTRKGIVPLCADIAGLMRAKRSLERNVLRLKQENDVLRSSTSSLRTSHSTSPTPPSLSSYMEKGRQLDQSYQDRYHGFRPYSRCSQSSSIVSNSPKFDKTNFYKISSYSPASSHDSASQQGNSPSSGRNRASQQGNSPSSGRTSMQRSTSLCTTQAVVHRAPDDILLDADHNYSHSIEVRNNSLPEITSQPSETACRVGPAKITTQSNGPDGHTEMTSHLKPLDKETHTEALSTTNEHAQNGHVASTSQTSETSQSPSTREEVQYTDPQDKEVQCNLPQHTDRALEEQFIQTVRLNSKLAQDLGAARKEVEVLTGRLKELEMNQLARLCSDQLLFETGTTDQHLIDAEGGKRTCNGYMKTTSLKRQSPPSLAYPSPLPGCKCSTCLDARSGSVEDLASYSDDFREDAHLFTVNSTLQIQLNDHVVVKGERTGCVQYIGHLENLGKPNMLFVGLELDAPVGNHDGFLDGKRYFYCRKDHGVVLPLQDVLCKVDLISKGEIPKPREKSPYRRTDKSNDKSNDKTPNKRMDWNTD
ncbi:hypothetical protein ScPMuIL_017080 [Solemya velum]